MTTARMDRVLRHLRYVTSRQGCERATDSALLERFLFQAEEAAFAELVRRHGPMVLGVCRRVLGDHHDADDAFQATFLVLARKASSVRPRSCVGPWLYGVARRTALKARSSSARRRRAEQEAARERPRETFPVEVGTRLHALIDEALGQLPEKYRAPLVLCLLQGKSRKEAAAALGWSEGTLSGRLARAKGLLGDRLRRRGVAPAAALLSGAFVTEVSASLVAATARSALAGPAVSLLASAPVITLTEEVLRAMLMSKLRKAVGLLALVTGIGFGTGAAAWYGGPMTRPAAPGEATAAKDTGASGEKKAKAAVRPDYVIEPPDVLVVEYAHRGDADPVKITGRRLVRPDGTIGLGLLGSVQVSGLTVAQAREAVAKHLAGRLDGFDAKKLTVEVKASNSKVIYVIVEGAGGKEVYRFPADGNQSVLDVLTQVKGALVGLGKKRVYILRQSERGQDAQVLEVDWKAITMEGRAATNYLLLPGDRVHIERAAPGRASAPVDASFRERLSPPSEADVLRTLPKTWDNANNISITYEALAHRPEPTRTFPLVGPARLVHVHWKCTVFSDRGVEVVYLDRNHLVPSK